ncbi:MAG: hypothetical protein GTO17_10915 [Candidatus Aminicenantes bacterium]|nr:hypothetical protein [Candidatus Aminicenantes bacterium]
MGRKRYTAEQIIGILLKAEFGDNSNIWFRFVSLGYFCHFLKISYRFGMPFNLQDAEVILSNPNFSKSNKLLI